MDSGVYRALLIGNWSFPEDPTGLPGLMGPKHDISVLRTALTDYEHGLFSAENVGLLEDLPKKEITTRMERFFDEAGREDKLLLYYSGHGELDRHRDYYLCARDTSRRWLVSTAISNDEVNRMIRKSRARTFVVILDCCNSGRWKASARLPDLLKGRGRFVIASSGPSELSPDAKQADSPSPFTRHLANALTTSALAADAGTYVTLDAIYRYLFDELEREGPQQPERHFDSTVGMIALAKRVARPAEIVVPPEPDARKPSRLHLSEEDIELRAIWADEAVPDEVVEVTDDAGAPIEWSTRSNSEWITVVRRSQTSFAMVLRPRPGLNRGKVLVHSLTVGETRVVRVEIRVVERPRLKVDRHEVDFGQLPAGEPSPSSTVRMTNAGGGDLNGVGRVAGRGIQLRQEGELLALTVDTTVAGRVEGEVVVESAGGRAVIPVRAHVVRSPSAVPAAPGMDESATAGSRRFSGDGAWWWSGRRWVPATTEDGLWKWDGARWKGTVDLKGKRPKDLATTLALLAEDRYAEAGEILAQRTATWQPEGGLRDLVERTREVGRLLGRVSEGLNVANSGRGQGSRPGAPTDDRRQLADERESLNSEHRALMVRLGRSAPQPSINEADDLLAAARLLDERAALMTAGLAEVDEAERMRADVAAAAQRELAAAEDARLRALQEARRAVEATESAHAWAVQEARTGVRTVLAPGPGKLITGIGPLRLYANLLETPTGRLSMASAVAVVDTASWLWAEHKSTLAELVLVEAPETDVFMDAAAASSQDLFLHVVGGGPAAALWPCPQGQEKAARRFATMVTDHARTTLRPEAVPTSGPGELRAELGPLRLFDRLLETPLGRLAASGAVADVGSAQELWAARWSTLADLVLLEAPETDAFIEALTEGASTQFLLVVGGGSASALCPCPPGQEKTAQRFATVVCDHAREAGRNKRDRDERALLAEVELDQMTRDRSSIEAAETELGRVENDPGLLGVIADARERLNSNRADTPDLIEARRKVLELARRLEAPPEPLRVAT